MRIIKSDALPFFWWAFPWSVARDLHQAAVALKAYADHADRTLDLQASIIDGQAEEIAALRQRLADLDASIVAGRAIVPDAQPVEEETR